MKRKKDQKNKAGISLIVLVITIIVIIILAVAVILSISNNNPIENARKARFQGDLKTIQEDVNLYVGKQYVDAQGKYNLEECDFAGETMLNTFTSIPKEYEEKIAIVDGKVTLVTDKVSEQESKWAEEVGILASNKEEEEYPVIPLGFSHKEGTVDDGYVIVNDTDGNEFVWVPVDDISTFEREGFGDTVLNTTNYTEPYSYNGAKADVSETAEYEAMRKSVENYHGFYIARYEASGKESGVAQSKKNQPSWNFIPWGNNMTDLSGGAVEKARAVYQNSDKADDSKYAVSTLCYGVEWDATVRWLKKSYPTITENSNINGNYNASSTINTGSREEYKTNNIYDMCGNLSEWTMEGSYDYGRVARGGHYNDDGTIYSISGRFNGFPDSNGIDQGVGFRIALYIK